MTSTNVFMGLNNDRNSSRVLRPPGGGNTDVLGLKAGPEEPPKKGNPKNVSSFTVEGGSPQREKPAPVAKEPQTETAATPAAAAPAAPARARVPPGGFSSGGFW